MVYLFERFPTFTQTFCVREVLELERQGLRPLIFSIRDTRDEPAQSYPEELRDRVHYLPPREELVKFVKQLRTEKKLSKSADRTLRFWRDQPDKLRVYEAAYIAHQIQQLAPELTHAHCHFGGKAARTLWWLRHFQSMSYSFTAHANDVFCAETKTEVSMNHLMRDASRVVTVSDYTVRRLSEEYPSVRAKIQRVYNGLELEKWVNASQGKPKGIGSGKIYSVGRLIEKKGFDDLIRASAQLRDRGVDHTCHVIGGGPLEDELRQQIKDHRLEDIFHLEGEMDQAGIIHALANEAHLFALPCVTEADGGMDNLPTVIMEAMAVGLPCVSTRLAGVPEMVLENQTGLLVNEREPEALAEQLKLLLEDTGLCETFGREGFELAAKRFDKTVTAANMKRTLISGGMVRFDPELIHSKPALALRYACQLPLRFGRMLGLGRSFYPKTFLAGDLEKSQVTA